MLPGSVPAALLDLYCESMGIRPQPPDVQAATAACLSEVATLLATPLATSDGRPNTIDTIETGVQQRIDSQTAVDKVISLYSSLLQHGCPAAVRCIVQQLPQLSSVVGCNVASERLVLPLLDPVDSGKDKHQEDKQAFVMMSVVPVLTQLLAALPRAVFQRLLQTVAGFVLRSESSNVTSSSSGHDASPRSAAVER